MEKDCFETLSESKKALVKELMETINCTQENAIFWLKFYSWDIERAKKYFDGTKSIKEATKKICDAASDINKFAKIGLKATIRSTDEAIKKVNDMAEKFKTNYNSIVDLLKENNWDFEKVYEILSKEKNQQVEENDQYVTFNSKIKLDELIDQLKSQDESVKIKIVMALLKDGGENLIRKLVNMIP